VKRTFANHPMFNYELKHRSKKIPMTGNWKHGGWYSQYERIHRLIKRFGEGKEDSIYIRTEDFLDDIFILIQNIYFLKDWIFEDSDIDAGVLNTYVEENNSLKLCRDICNVTKHHTLTRTSAGWDFDMAFGLNSETGRFDRVIYVDEEVKDVEFIIRDALRLWDDFIAINLNGEEE